MKSTRPKSQNRDAEKPKRKAPPTAFKPGQSGNPGGRPKELAEVQALARTHTVDAIAALARIAGSADAPPAAVVSAATALLDRAWGKPMQPIDSNQPAIGITFVVEG